jgi:hypothetical protein
VSGINLSGVSGKLSIPLLVVAGGCDPVVPPDDARRLAREAPVATLLKVADELLIQLVMPMSSWSFSAATDFIGT